MLMATMVVMAAMAGIAVADPLSSASLTTPTPSAHASEATANGGLGYAAVRAHSEALCEPLAIEDYGVQPIVDASPPRWHLAHTTWFFETFLLKPFRAGYQPFHPAFEYLFNSYYNGVGEQFPRPDRGTLSRPTVAEVLAYRHYVDEAMARLLASEDPDVQSRIQLGLHHEQQHQELMLTDIKANLGLNPLKPAYRPGPVAAADDVPLMFEPFAGGIVEVGAGANVPFCFDNERPRHKAWLEEFALANRLTTNAEYAEFIADGGYRTPSLWLSEGWAWRSENAVEAPMYWRQADGAWLEYRLDGEHPLSMTAPVAHVSHFEADAFARWAQARLPTEAEWEVAATCQTASDSLPAPTPTQPALHPSPATVNHSGLQQLSGACWQWTSSAYGPYPKYSPLAGTLGEYNGKFMSGQLVLRGGSCATPPGHTRPTYRNFFYPKDRWQFTGIRLAKSVGESGK